MIHFLQFFFAQPGKPWYEAAVYGNIVAVAPCGAILWLWLRSRHVAVLEAHEALKAAHLSHAEKLDRLLDHFDPDTGTVAELHMKLDAIIAHLKHEETT
jgi:hypothetical protein